MDKEDIINKVRRKFERLSGVLDERGRRMWAAARSTGSVTIVERCTTTPA